MQTPINKENTIQSISFIGVLILCFALSLYACLFSRELLSEQENRTLAVFPKIHTWKKDLPKFSGLFEPFFKDHLPFRLALISARNFATFEIFHTSANPLVVVGKQNWLFFKSYGVTPAQLNLAPFTEHELHDWAQNFVERNTFLKEHHIKYLLVFAPEKGTMYPELLPIGWHRAPGVTRLEQLQNYLKEHTAVDTVDALGLLSGEKIAGQKIYHSNDTHWNQRSAFLVSQAILSHLHRDFDTVHPVPAKDLLQGHDTFNGDLSKMLGLQNVLPDYSPSIIVNRAPHAVTLDASTKLASMGSLEKAFATEIKDAALPRALVLRDSFSTYLTAPLSEHFRFCEYQWTNIFQPQEILDEKPDIVINEIAERHLYEEVHEHVPDTASKTVYSADTPICTYGKTLELLGLKATNDYSGITLKARWRSTKPTKLNYTVGLQCLDSGKKVVGAADYQPDILKREINQGAEWTDTVLIPNRELKNANQLGIQIYFPSTGTTMSCDAPNCDWGTRLVVLISKFVT